MPPQVTRSWVMAATAIRLGLRPPATRPGQWFPEEDTAKVTCWRKRVTAKNPAGDAVYIGQTEGCSRSPRTKWASPFVPGQHGTPAECFTKYELWFRSQRELRDSLNEIAGRELACECPPCQPCHADFLASQARMKLEWQSRNPMAIQKRGKLLLQLVTPGFYIFCWLAPFFFRWANGNRTERNNTQFTGFQPPLDFLKCAGMRAS